MWDSHFVVDRCEQVLELRTELKGARAQMGKVHDMSAQQASVMRLSSRLLHFLTLANH